MHRAPGALAGEESLYGAPYTLLSLVAFVQGSASYGSRNPRKAAQAVIGRAYREKSLARCLKLKMHAVVLTGTVFSLLFLKRRGGIAGQEWLRAKGDAYAEAVGLAVCIRTTHMLGWCLRFTSYAMVFHI
mmetsp:Transcript_15890/g.43225  ORF Transcript_15890/g.43225 Transcript_15890/m.43225 type:complete len:130 (+) Transcript_15890:2383-2772(+)